MERSQITPNEKTKRELSHLKSLLGSNQEVWKTLQHQFGVLYQRTTTLFTLGGITITVTGFSGNRIVQAGLLSASFLISGLVLSLLAMCVGLFGISRIRWISLYQGKNSEESLELVIGARDRKTRLFNIALGILLTGLTFYVIAVSLFLLASVRGVVSP